MHMYSTQNIVIVLLELFASPVEFLQLEFISFTHLFVLLTVLLARFQLSLETLNFDLVVGQLPLEEAYLSTELAPGVLFKTEDSIFGLLELL